MAKVRATTLAEFKQRGEKFTALTSYDAITSAIFDQAGIDVLLVGDSAADTVLGHDSTLAVTVDEMIMIARPVAKSAHRALVVVDMPFGSYELGGEQALENALKIIKLSTAEAVKLEGGTKSVEQIRRIVEAGIPVMAHIGFTPQSVNSLGGFKVQGRGEGAAKLREDALAVEAAGAFAVVLELVPADLAAEITKELQIPTIGIGAGPDTDGQILVWTDMAGFSDGRPKKFVKQFGDLRNQLTQSVVAYREEVKAKQFPAPENSFE